MYLQETNLLILIGFILSVFGQQTTPDGCFKQYNNVREGCLVSFEKRHAVTQQDCTNLCLQFASECKAANYNIKNQQCELYRQAGQLPNNGRKKRSPKNPFNGVHVHSHGNYGGGYSRCDGTKPLEINCPGNIYYVPTGTCTGVSSSPVTMPATTQCPIVRKPQKLLVGYAESVVTAASFDDCLQQCQNSQARFGFKCSSGMFYSTESANNCILNSESATTKPELFIDENKDTVEYFEPCPTSNPPAPRFKRGIENLKPDRHRNVIWLDSASWGSWTRCDGKQRSRMRYRSCKSFNPNKCQRSDLMCEPKNREQEWAEILQEEEATTTASPTTTTTTVASTTASSTTTIAIVTSTTSITIPVVDIQPTTTNTNFVQATTVNAKNNGNGDQSGKICEAMVKPDGTKDCKRGFRKAAKGDKKVPCKPKITNDNC